MTVFSANTFSSLQDATFSPHVYSQMKFGHNAAAKHYGHELAIKFFAAHMQDIISKRIVVIPSPYNYVENAATIMTRHFINKINELLVDHNGEHVEYMTIQRKISYISDYGFLTADKRKALIDGDEFYLDEKYLEGKLLIFIDDVKITGTHERKLVELLDDRCLFNERFFLYAAAYTGSSPEIEAEINFAAIKDLKAFRYLANVEGHRMIVRPLKYILGQPAADFDMFVCSLEREQVETIVHSSLNEGYYRIPAYQENLNRARYVLKHNLWGQNTVADS